MSVPVLSDVIKASFYDGETTGPVNGSIDLSEPDSLKGLIARKQLELTIGNQLVIKGHIVGGEKAVFDGPGVVRNQSEISKTDHIESHVSGFSNEKTMRAYHSIAFDSLTQGLTNHELMLSEEA